MSRMINGFHWKSNFNAESLMANWRMVAEFIITPITNLLLLLFEFFCYIVVLQTFRTIRFSSFRQ